MKIRRTACAGVLLELDGIRILLDGVGREVKPYPATPPEIRQELMDHPPDALLITHKHEDHYDEDYVSWLYESTACPILGPADIPRAKKGPVRIGDVRMMAVESRHIGRRGFVEHQSYILRGSQCVWFLGDASPLVWKNQPCLPKPDVLIAPYAYGMGMGWEIAKSLGPKAVILLHLPEREKDRYGLWGEVESTIGQGRGPAVHILQMGNSIRPTL